MATGSPLQRFDVLFEADDLPTFALPRELNRLLGGDLGFDDTCLYANFVSTLDGVVAIPSIPRSNDVISAGSDADRFLMGVLRAFADVVLIGAGTLRASPQGMWRPEKVYPPAGEAFSELRHRLGRAGAPEVAILTGRGSIDPSHPVLESGALVLTSEPGASRLKGRLSSASTVVSLGGEATIDPSLAVRALHDRGHRLILSEAGPHSFGGVLGAGVVDELFLTLSPLLVGNADEGSRVRLVEAVDLASRDVRGRLLSLRRHGAHVFLRYELNRPASG